MKTVEQRLADLEAAVFDKHNETRVSMAEVPWDEWCAQPCACGHPRMEHTGKNGDGSCNGAGRPCDCEQFVHAAAPVQVATSEGTIEHDMLYTTIANLRAALAARDTEIVRLKGILDDWNHRISLLTHERDAHSEARDAAETAITGMRPIVDAAVEWWADTPRAVPILLEAIKTYQQQKSNKG